MTQKAILLPDILAQSAAQKAAAIYFCGSISTLRTVVRSQESVISNQ